MRVLHVAALPFPSHQGTQALLHEMLLALTEAGHESHLLCYGHGAFTRQTSYHVHRTRGVRAARSLRSGPSVGKLLLDALLVRELRKLAVRLRPELVVAHHVEAGMAALLASTRPLLFVAHTSLSGELASYFPGALAGPCGLLGRELDRLICRRAERVVAVSPLLAQRLATEADVAVHPLAPPWTVPPAIEPGERASARRALGLGVHEEVVLYAGNLDSYQGLPPLALGLSMLARPQLRWLIATESSPDELVPLLRSLGLERRVLFSSIASEVERRKVHAAADVALIPRRSPGGLPIKLLDALARGLPVVATQRALAGVELGAACTVIADDDPHAWRQAVTDFFASPPAVAPRGPSLMRIEHGRDRFVADFLRHSESCLQAAAIDQRAGFFRSASRE